MRSFFVRWQATTLLTIAEVFSLDSFSLSFVNQFPVSHSIIGSDSFFRLQDHNFGFYLLLKFTPRASLLWRCLLSYLVRLGTEVAGIDLLLQLVCLFSLRSLLSFLVFDLGELVSELGLVIRGVSCVSVYLFIIRWFFRFVFYYLWLRFLSLHFLHWSFCLGWCCLFSFSSSLLLGLASLLFLSFLWLGFFSWFLCLFWLIFWFLLGSCLGLLLALFLQGRLLGLSCGCLLDWLLICWSSIGLLFSDNLLRNRSWRRSMVCRWFLLLSFVFHVLFVVTLWLAWEVI